MSAWMTRWQRPAWADELDFVGPRVRTAPWAWAVLLAGVLAMGWALPQVQQADEDLAEAHSLLKRLQRASHQQALAAKAQALRPVGGAASEANAPPVLKAEVARQAAQWAQWLAYPWLRVLGEVEAAAQSERAVMLSFSLDLATLASADKAWPEARLSAAVRDDAAALKWAQALGPQAQLLTRDKASQPFTNAAGTYAWRAEAVWAGGQP